MINITEKKNQVRELINQSSLCKLMGMQEKFLRDIANLPDEANEEEEKALDMLQKAINLSENDPDMQETIHTCLKLREAWKDLVVIEEQTLKDQIAIVQEGIRRLDEIKARRDRDPEASIDDLLVPVVINPVP